MVVDSFLSPLWGLFLSCITTHGWRRGLHSSAASRLTSRAAFLCGVAAGFGSAAADGSAAVTTIRL